MEYRSSIMMNMQRLLIEGHNTIMYALLRYPAGRRNRRTMDTQSCDQNADHSHAYHAPAHIRVLYHLL